MSSIKKGDNVTWNTPQGATHGQVEKTLTKDTKLGGKTYKASKEEPKVLVKSQKSGKKAIHNQDSVTKDK